MKISCPHCHQHVNVVDASDESSSMCPACGSNLLATLDTLTYKPPEVEIIGGFDLLERVGIGHFGEVWKARDRQLRRIVALKMPRLGQSDSLARHSFIREARAAAKLRHPNIVAVHDVREEGDQAFIVSEFVEGVSLASFLRQEKLSFEQAARFCAEIADALEHAHQQGVIHRDLKPANILIEGELIPRLTDFGLAKQEGDEFTITVEGQILGTPAYMSPEQASGHGHQADARSDIYSLGVILYEMLAGKRPFGGESQLLVHQILYEPPPPPRRIRPLIPSDLETICLTALAKEPGRRYASAGEFANDLRRYLSHEPIRARRASAIERFGLWCRRKPASAALLAVILAAVAIIAGILVQSRAQIAEIFRQNQVLSGKITQGKQNLQQSQEELAETKRKVPLSLKRVPVRLATEPPGAMVKFIPLNSFDGSLEWEKATTYSTASATNTCDLLPGDYLVVARSSNGDFHEVFRRVPGDRREVSGDYPHLQFQWTPGGYDLATVYLTSTGNVTKDMVLVKGGTFLLDRFETKISHLVSDFYLDVHEVTVEKFRRFRSEPIDSSAGDDYPVTNISWDDAVAYAEFVGKIVPDEVMYEFAATSQGQSRFPWGDDASRIGSWSVQAVGQPAYDRAVFAQPPIQGLFSGALEWTSTPAQALSSGDVHRPLLEQAALNYAIVRGGPASALTGTIEPRELVPGATVRFGQPWSTRHPRVGFRCARSARPRWEAVMPPPPK